MATPSPTTTVTTASPSPPPSPVPASPFIETAAILNALAWPIAITLVALILREKLPAIGRILLSRVTEVGFAGFSLKLAEVKSFDPKWSNSATSFDLRNKGIAAKVWDSNVSNFISQLQEFDSADYAIITLGDGKEWLTSRLYIMAIILERMKSLKALVFLGVRKRFIGWAEPEQVRWALAKQYPHLESAYAKAYAEITRSSSDISAPGSIPPDVSGNAVVVTTTGRLGYKSNPNDPKPSTYLIRSFLEHVQAPPLPLPKESGELNTDWILVNSNPDTYEHAIWLTTDKLEDLLDEDLCTRLFDKETLEAKAPEEQIRWVLSTPYRWIALTTDEKRFEGLSDRNLLLKQISKQFTKNT
jgi:hypothetical protein